MIQRRVVLQDTRTHWLMRPGRSARSALRAARVCRATRNNVPHATSSDVRHQRGRSSPSGGWPLLALAWVSHFQCPAAKLGTSQSALGCTMRRLVTRLGVG
jgi:hypothetical protein